MTWMLRLALLVPLFVRLPALAADAPAAPCARAPQLQAAGFDAARLCAILDEFAATKTNFHGLVIERHGAVVAEAYRRGKDQTTYSLFATSTDFDATTRHDLRSISKSITSLLWGIAQGQNKTPHVDTPVLDLLPDLSDLKSQGREAITIAHLLSMSSGLQWNESNNYGSASNEETGLYWHSSQAKYLFNRPLAAPPGTHFNYNGGNTAVLAQILAERVKQPLPEFAREFLFEPLGITDWEWKSDVRGRPLAFSGVRMRPRDLAKIGRMVLNHGRWEGKQVVPAGWIADSTAPHMQTDNGFQYGYQWWAGKASALGENVDWSAGIGNGGQRLFMVPKLDLVVVITAGEYNKPEIGRMCNQLFRNIAAAVKS
jgi:CubicO group peptidase (beta-lactamase class C family)